MTNKQRYQRTFGTLHASGDFLKEVSAMKTTKHFPARRLIGLCAAVILILFFASPVCGKSFIFRLILVKWGG